MNEITNSQIIIYQTEDGETKLDVYFVAEQYRKIGREGEG